MGDWLNTRASCRTVDLSCTVRAKTKGREQGQYKFSRRSVDVVLAMLGRREAWADGALLQPKSSARRSSPRLDLVHATES